MASPESRELVVLRSRQKPSPFFLSPLEIRTLIYEACLVQESPIFPGQDRRDEYPKLLHKLPPLRERLSKRSRPVSLGLLGAARQIRAEASFIYYSRNTFVLPVFSDQSWIADEHLISLRNIVLKQQPEDMSPAYQREVIEESCKSFSVIETHQWISSALVDLWNSKLRLIAATRLNYIQIDISSSRCATNCCDIGYNTLIEFVDRCSFMAQMPKIIDIKANTSFRVSGLWLKSRLKKIDGKPLEVFRIVEEILELREGSLASYTLV